jgi:hypothetical protein
MCARADLNRESATPPPHCSTSYLLRPINTIEKCMSGTTRHNREGFLHVVVLSTINTPVFTKTGSFSSGRRSGNYHAGVMLDA